MWASCPCFRMKAGISDFLGMAMALHLLIDGYNLMGCSGNSREPFADPLEENREQLMEKIARYRGLKGAQVILVFDGGKGGYPTRRSERKWGMEVIYSKLGEEADQVIKNILQEGRKPYVVVTSDNAILNFAEARGFAFIRSREFEEKMEIAAFLSEKGMLEEEEMRDEESGARKKGNPKRLSKKERKRRAILKKI